MEKIALEWLEDKIQSDMTFMEILGLIRQAKEMHAQEKGFSEDDVNLAFFLGKKDDHVRLHKLINSRLGELKSE